MTRPQKVFLVLAAVLLLVNAALALVHAHMLVDGYYYTMMPQFGITRYEDLEADVICYVFVSPLDVDGYCVPREDTEY